MYGGKKWYPLLLAAHRGDVSFVESLLDAGAEINYVDESGNTALRMAIEAGHPGAFARRKSRYGTCSFE